MVCETGNALGQNVDNYSNNFRVGVLVKFLHFCSYEILIKMEIIIQVIRGFNIFTKIGIQIVSNFFRFLTKIYVSLSLLIPK